jgi:hypothetical protein
MDEQEKKEMLDLMVKMIRDVDPEFSTQDIIDFFEYAYLNFPV